MRIVIDAFGGDNAPEAAVDGALMALEAHKGFTAVLTGDETRIRSILQSRGYDGSRVEVVHTTEVIDCHEQPTLAIKRKKNSSMVRALDMVAKKEADAVVSAGSTGALLTGATLIVRRLKGVKRPAIATVIPTLTGCMMLADCGANADCKPSYIQQFAVMADAYMRNVMKVERPRVALLNNGAEEGKGNELTKAAYSLLKDTPVNFTGNCEARDILTGCCDVLVTDGFSGNIVLKYTEGLASSLMTMLKDELISDTRSKIGAGLAKPAFRRFKKRMDYTEYGGAPLLGIDGGVIKAHGSSNAKAFCSAIGQAITFTECGVNPDIQTAIAALPEVGD